MSHELVVDSIIRLRLSWQDVGIWILISLFAGVFIDITLTKWAVAKAGGIPVVGSPWQCTPRWVSNLLFAWNAAEILKKGYNSVSNEPLSLCLIFSKSIRTNVCMLSSKHLPGN